MNLAFRSVLLHPARRHGAVRGSETAAHVRPTTPRRRRAYDGLDATEAPGGTPRPSGDGEPGRPWVSALECGSLRAHVLGFGTNRGAQRLGVLPDVRDLGRVEIDVGLTGATKL